MKFSILELLKLAYTIITKDKLILFPYLIFFLILHIVMTVFPISIKENTEMSVNVLAFLFCAWIIELFFKGITVSMAYYSEKKSTNILPEAITHTVMSFHHMVLSIGSLLLPLFFIMKVILPGSDDQSIFSLALNILFLGIIICIFFIIQLLPVIIIVDKQSWLNAILTAYRFLIKQFKNMLIFISLLLSILIIIFLLSAISHSIPIFGAIFEVIFKASGYTYSYVLTTVFYLQLNKKENKLN